MIISDLNQAYNTDLIDEDILRASYYSKKLKESMALRIGKPMSGRGILDSLDFGESEPPKASFFQGSSGFSKETSGISKGTSPILLESNCSRGFLENSLTLSRIMDNRPNGGKLEMHESTVNLEEMIDDEIFKKYENLLLSTEFGQSPGKLQESISDFESGIIRKLEDQENQEREISKLVREIVRKNLKMADECPTKRQHDQISKTKSPSDLVAFELKYHLGRIDSKDWRKLSKLQAEVISDFLVSRENYSEDQMKLMASLKKGEVIWVVSAFSEEWVVVSKEENFFPKIAPKTNLKFLYNLLPKPIRNYEVKFWNSFGFSGKEESQRSPGAKDKEKLDVAQFGSSQVLIKSFNVIHLLKGTTTNPKIVYIGLKSFNSIKREKFVYEDIPLLSFERGDFIVATKLPNHGGVCEGYVLNKAEATLGLFMTQFVSPVKIN